MLLKTFFTPQRLSHTNLSCSPKAMEAVAKESVDPFSANYNPVLGEKPLKFEAIFHPERDCSPTSDKRVKSCGLYTLPKQTAVRKLNELKPIHELLRHLAKMLILT